MVVDLATAIDGGLERQPFDALIVGSGPAGLVLATELAKAGKRVCVAEAGTEEYSNERQRPYAPAAAPDQYADPTFCRLRMLGGSSNHWQASTTPFDPIDFEELAWVPGSGWPISLDDLKPFYQKAAIACGTGDDGYGLARWSRQLGMQAEHQFALSGELAVNVVKASQPPRRFFNDNRAEIDSLQGLLVLSAANLVALDFDGGTGLVRRAKLVGYAGEEATVSARAFVLACGGIENARLLLNFNEEYQNRLGNQSESLGRYFMDHPLLLAAAFFPSGSGMDFLDKKYFDDSRRVNLFLQLGETSLRKHKLMNIRMPFHKATQFEISSAVESLRVLRDNGASTDDLMAHIGNVFGDIDMAVEAISRSTFERRLFDHAQDFGGYRLPIMIQQAPHRANRVTLGPERDQFGLKRCLIDWKLQDSDLENMWRSLEVVGDSLSTSGLGTLDVLREFEDDLRSEKLFFSYHHMGTTRMAETPSKGVVDRHCRVFGTENLYVAGSSVFVTGSHVPPTLTIAALALRLGAYLSERL